MSEVIRFHNPSAFTGLTGVVDFKNATIHGVSLITGELSAEGHNLWVDSTTLQQLHSLGKSMGQIPVTQDHEGGIKEVNGWIENIRLDGNKLRGDWVLLKSHKETETMLERADRQSSTFGLSLAFKGDPKGVLFNGKQCARAEKLLSADVVKRPAANEGLFSAKDGTDVDSLTNSIRSKNIELHNTMPAEPTLADVLAQLQSMQATIAQQGEALGQIQQGGQQEESYEFSPEETAELTRLYGLSDEALAAEGVDRTKLNEIVAQHDAWIGSQGDQSGQEQGEEAEGNYEGSYGEQGEAQGEAAGAGAQAGAAAGGQAFKALEKQLIQLTAKFNAKEAKEIQFAEKQASDEVRGKIALIVKQRDDLREFAEKAVAKIEALEVHLKTGTRPVAAGVDNGVRLFAAGEDGQLHPFQQKLKAIMFEKKCSEGKAMAFADKEDNGALHNLWLQSLSKQTIRA